MRVSESSWCVWPLQWPRVPAALPLQRAVAQRRRTRRAMEGRHFHPKGKPASNYTIELQDGVRASLPFEDKRDFEEARRASSPRRPTSRSWPRPATSPGTSAATTSCSSGKDFDSDQPVAAAPGRAQHGLRPLRGGAGQDLPGAWLRPGQHQLHQGRHRLDPVRRADRQGNRAGRRWSSSTRSSASVRWSPSSTRTRTPITSAACAAWWTRPTSRAARCRSSRRSVSWKLRSPRTSMPATR